MLWQPVGFSHSPLHGQPSAGSTIHDKECWWVIVPLILSGPYIWLPGEEYEVQVSRPSFHLLRERQRQRERQREFLSVHAMRMEEHGLSASVKG